ncbi:hypothetical protein ADUPG1_008029 [Aduncisulcus paluster]|uniref:START domain-containing protein n=1 Tax=Aduncisulcus paluster TaxID=2918883 RepID=A0ABQ5KRV5_9EUKA|nr:hypothetical protein ADUPG1_008029 [Aduncisulcus paluster]
MASKVWKSGKGSDHVQISSTRDIPLEHPGKPVAFKSVVKIPGPSPRELALAFFNIETRSIWGDMVKGGRFLKPWMPMAMTSEESTANGFVKLESCDIHYLYDSPTKLASPRDSVIRVVMGTRSDNSVVCAYWTPEGSIAGANPGETQVIDGVKYLRCFIHLSGLLITSGEDKVAEFTVMDITEPLGAVPSFLLKTQGGLYVKDYESLWRLMAKL